MKHFIFITLLSFLAQFTGAQTWTDENNVWTYCHVGYNSWNENYPMCELSFTKFFFNGEQIVEGKKYKELWYQQILYNNTLIGTPDTWRLTTGTVTTEPVYFIGVREDNGRIYVKAEEYCKQTGMNEYKIQDLLDNGIIKQLKNEYILYDFNETPPTGVIPYIGNIYDLFFRFIDLPTDGIIRKDFLNLFFRKGEKEYQSPDYISDPFFSARQYRPLAKEGKVWKYRYNKGSNGVSTPLYYSYAIHGDTVINGTAYKKLYMQHSRYSIYTAALRDEGHNALMVPADSTREFYYYDLELKDSIGLAFGLGAKPHGSTIVNEGAPRRMQWTIWPLPQHMVYEWVEGVGTLQDDFFRCSFWEKPDEWDTGSTLIACLEDNECIWGDESAARDMQRYEIPLAYTNKAGDGRRPSEIWVEWEEGFITVYFKDVKDEFTLYIDDDSVKTFQGNQYFTFPLWARTLNFRLESDFESFAFAASNGVAVPEVGRKHFTNPLFDLSGRRLDTPPAKGIYIRDGKKILR